jgi:hypothetical protein
VLTGDASFFDKLQGAIRTLDEFWPQHDIAVYDLGLVNEQRELVSYAKTNPSNLSLCSCKRLAIGV